MACLKTFNIYMRDLMLPPRSRWKLRSCGLSRSE